VGSFKFVNTTINNTTEAAIALSSANVKPATNHARITYTGGTISQTSKGSGAVISVSGGDTSSLSFGNNSDTGTLITATSGGGLSFDKANGTYDFSGAQSISLSKIENGISISGSSTGAFKLANTTIKNTTGAAIALSSKNTIPAANHAKITYTGGTISQTKGSGAVVGVSGGDTSNITFGNDPSTGTSITAKSGGGLSFDKAHGTYDFSGVKSISLSQIENGISISSGSRGTFKFANTTIKNTIHAAIKLSGSSAKKITYEGGEISQSQNGNGAVISVSKGDASNLSFGVSSGLNTKINATVGPGLKFDGARGTYDFSGAKTTISGTAHAISITGKSSGNYTFKNISISDTVDEPFYITHDSNPRGKFDGFLDVPFISMQPGYVGGQ